MQKNMKSNKERAVTQSVVGGQRPWNLERITARTPLPAVMSAVSGPGQQKLSTTATERHGNGNSNQSPNPWALERIEQMERIGGRRRAHGGAGGVVDVQRGRTKFERSSRAPAT